MTDLLAARSQMAMSLAFHMLFATAGIGMPLLMILAEAIWLRTGEPVARELAQRWAKGTAILFAVGAVSGTVLSFELGLLWPTFMAFAGPIIGMPFSLEGFAFFFEAIFLGIYLYGWDRVPRLVHWLSGLGVLVAGTMSGVFVVTANAWMNTPAGFELAADGSVLSVDPLAAMLNPSSLGQVLHMTVAAFLATAFLTAGIHAWYLLKNKRNAFHQQGLIIALAVGVVMTPLQPLTGHIVAEAVAHKQPVKLAALEALWETTERAPFTLGGWPDEAAEETRYGIEIPGLLSLLAYRDVNAEVMGLSDVPPDLRPPVLITHLAYQIMLLSMATLGGTALLTVVWVGLRRRLPLHSGFLWVVVLNAPMGLVGIEAGWTATEVGRQPWVITGVLRTADAVTPLPHLVVPFLGFTLLYLVLAAACVWLLRRQFVAAPHIHDQQEPGDDA